MKDRVIPKNLLKSNPHLYFSILDRVMERAFFRLAPSDRRSLKLPYMRRQLMHRKTKRLGVVGRGVSGEYRRAVVRFRDMLRDELKRTVKELRSAKSLGSPKIELSLSVLSDALKRISRPRNESIV